MDFEDGGRRRLEGSVVTVVTAIGCCPKASWVADEPFLWATCPMERSSFWFMVFIPSPAVTPTWPAKDWWGRCLPLLDYRPDQVIHFGQWAISRYEGNIGLK